MKIMDNNTAQNNGIAYPDIAQGSSNQPTNQVVPDDTQVLSDLADQLKKIQSGEEAVSQPTPSVQEVPTPPVQESIATTIQETPTPPEPQFELPEQAVPVPTNIATENSVGIVRGSLDDIMPGERKPKALQRTPKDNNVAQPIQQDSGAMNTARKDVLAKMAEQGIKMEGLIDGMRHSSIDELLRIAIQNNASDLHISVGYPPIMRVDGALKNINETIVTPQDAEELILPILSDEKKELLEVNREIDLAYFHQGENSARFRVNAYFSMKNLSAAFRLIPSRVKTIEELLLPQMYHQFSQLKQGLILVTGPTGHGKSTTLAAVLEDINITRYAHIVTIEDPIEYVFEGKRALIDQREMNDDTHSWNIALRSALRQDPDVILVGEMRDYETIAAAITLAETGHLVFATLHTNNSAQTIDRIIDVFPENQQPQIRSQLSNILEAVVSQRLVPMEKGGRRAVSEILIANPAIRNLIREGKTHQIDNVIRTSSDVGMVSLERSLVNLVREGVISVQRAQEYSIYPEEVLRLLKS